MTALESNWEGLPAATEHRTVGGRAWCYQDREWCYPESDMHCRCCDDTLLPERWKGMNGAAILADLREQVQAHAEATDDMHGEYLAALDWVLTLLGGDAS